MVNAVKISDKNQVALPAEELQAVGAKRGERLLVRARNGIIELIPERLAERILDDGLKNFKHAGKRRFAKGWDNPHDEAWNDA